MFVLAPAVVGFVGLSSTILSVQVGLYLEVPNDIIPVLLYTALLDSPNGGTLAPRGNSDTP